MATTKIGMLTISASIAIASWSLVIAQTPDSMDLNDLEGANLGVVSEVVSTDDTAVVGTPHDSGACGRPRWTIDDCMIGLGIVSVDLGSSHGENAFNDGTILGHGNGVNPQGRQEGWTSHIPEPTTCTLLAIGGWVLLQRRRLTPGVLVCAWAIGLLTYSPQINAEGWIQWSGNGHYYLPVAVSNHITWDDAQAAAESEGGHLATCTSEAENEFVFSLIADDQYWNSASYVTGPWIGGFQPEGNAGPSHDWQWITGESFTYANWYPEEPNDGWSGGEDYLQFSGGWNGPPSSKWNDACQNGHAVFGYVVESSVPEPSTIGVLALGGLALLRRKRKYTF